MVQLSSPPRGGDCKVKYVELIISCTWHLVWWLHYNTPIFMLISIISVVATEWSALALLRLKIGWDKLAAWGDLLSLIDGEKLQLKNLLMSLVWRSFFRKQFGKKLKDEPCTSLSFSTVPEIVSYCEKTILRS